MWSPWYVDTLLPASNNQVSIQTQLHHQHHHQPGTGWPPSAQLWRSNETSCYLPGRQCESILTFSRCLNAWLWQQSRKWLSIVLLLNKLCPCIPSVQTLSVLHWGDDSAQTTIEGTSKLHGDWSLECSPRKWRWEADHLRRTLFPQRKLILGGLRHLGMREVAPDTPRDPGRSAVWKCFMN